MDVGQVHEDLGGGHALEHEAPRLLLQLLASGDVLHVAQGVHGIERGRGGIEAFEPESLRHGIREAVQDVLLLRPDPALPLPPGRCGPLSDLDVQHAQTLETALQVAHHEHVLRLGARVLTRAALHLEIGHAGILHHELEQPLEARAARLGAEREGLLVEVDLPQGVAEVLANPTVPLYPWTAALEQLQAEKRRCAARGADARHRGAERPGVHLGEQLLLEVAAAATNRRRGRLRPRPAGPARGAGAHRGGRRLRRHRQAAQQRRRRAAPRPEASRSLPAVSSDDDALH
mmetsp:Transcript_62919/g.163436  ORF Transcript_62919/g.163436 Transcript_62919/m.163436 type:complete len:289 (+) Transcript_62919:1542-2408(+)